MQTVWLIESVVEARQAEIRRQVAGCRLRPPRKPARRPLPWRERLGWWLVERGLRLAVPAADPALVSAAVPRSPATSRRSR
jgi:hypothetical protein